MTDPIGWLHDARRLAHLMLGIRWLLKRRVTFQRARAVVRQRLAAREVDFARLMERDVYGHPDSPYLPLLRWAGCELGDVQSLLRQEGLEHTLRTLRQAGVYVTFEEFKGRTPIVRGSQRSNVSPYAFDRPGASRSFAAETSGSSGRASRTDLNMDFVLGTVFSRMVMLGAHGLDQMPMALWRGELPDPSGVVILLHSALMGNPPRRWFTPQVQGGLGTQIRYRLATRLCVLSGRLAGVPLPWPEQVPLERADVVARWAAAAVRRHGACMLRAHVSMALRICLAAQERGFSLAGVTFVSGGEPVTSAKRRQITASGARLVPLYASSEFGTIGMGCAAPADVDDMHLCAEATAAIQHPRTVPGTDVTVPAFCYTALLQGNPRVLINVESDDYGVLEERPCGCLLDEVGYRTHLRQIRSFSRLTGEGVTLIGSDMLRILEEVLPARFGGSALDYQLAEEEDEQGYTRLVLRVHPRLDLPAETEVVQTVLAALESSGGAASMAQAIWSAAGTLRVRRAEPIWTSRGKLLPLHLIRDLEQGRPTGARADRSSPLG